MASPDVSSIRAIPWKDVADSMTNYLSNEELIVGNLASAIDNLESEIQKRRQQRFPKFSATNKCRNSAQIVLLPREFWFRRRCKNISLKALVCEA